MKHNPWLAEVTTQSDAWHEGIDLSPSHQAAPPSSLSVLGLHVGIRVHNDDRLEATSARPGASVPRGVPGFVMTILLASHHKVSGLSSRESDPSLTLLKSQVGGATWVGFRMRVSSRFIERFLKKA